MLLITQQSTSSTVVFLSFGLLDSGGLLPVYNSIHRTVRYASSLACSFNQIIWGIKLKKIE
jgi:hypothetical protein